MARVLVTGANGFIGSHLTKALVASRDEVTCLVRKTSNLDRLNGLRVTIANGDITEPESLKEPISGSNVVYHVGACIRAVRKKDFYRVNVRGTGNVARVCSQQSNPPVLVVVSSLAAVAPTKDGTPIREDHDSAPVSHYGRSKRAAELAAAKYADRVPTTIVRASAVFGEADRGCLEMFKSIWRFGIHPCPLGLGVSMIHCADLVQLLMLAGQRGKRIDPPGSAAPNMAKGYYFGASTEYPMYSQFGRMMAKALGLPRILVLPLPLSGAWIVAGLNEMVGQLVRRPNVFDIDKCREATAGCWFCSPQTAIQELGFSLAATLSDRLEQTAAWYRAQGWL